MRAKLFIGFLFIAGIFFLISTAGIFAQKKNNLKKKIDVQKYSPIEVWTPDNGDGTYKNPILNADYSDPDAIRVGDDYYLTSSSFSHFPGLPILHSKDLVNWEIISQAVQKYPYESFNKPQHGNGIWAPSIRYHNGEFYIYYGDPDYGIFMTKAKDPRGPWDPLHLVRAAKGWIDSCPFWDDDGSAYLVHAWARSRSGIKHVITINKMSPDGKTLLDDGVKVFCDSVKHNTMEGPKLYKRNGYYYIYAPAGGVKPGWQTVLRSKNILGPYEDKIVLEKGSTKINGPHQGAWIQTQTGEDWFLHFQDRYAYGRIVHLQPMKWENDWPVIGIDYDKNGIGEPVATYSKPNVGSKKNQIVNPATNDEFDSPKLGLQWQCQANYSDEWYSLKERAGWLRLYSNSSTGLKNLYEAPWLILQKFPAVNFSAKTLLDCSNFSEGTTAGLIIFGSDYATVAINKTQKGLQLIQSSCNQADKGRPEKVNQVISFDGDKVYLKINVKESFNNENIPIATCTFYFSYNGTDFRKIGDDFIAKEGRWVGAKIGLFSKTDLENSRNNFADFDWIRFEKI